ncbi:MAG: arylesterase [Chromatocurvus sp.]
MFSFPSRRAYQQFSLRALLRSGCLICALFTLSATADSASIRLLVLGDSISAAYGMSLQEGWVALLEQRLTRDGAAVKTINASISGETTDGGRRRLPALLEQHEPDAVIIELGGNDGLRGYPVKQMRGNLISMAEAAQEAGALVLILPMEIPPNYGSRYATDFRSSFSAAAKTTGAKLGPFLLEGIATEPRLMQDDGIHPTRDAQSMIVDRLLADVLSLLQE